MIFNSYVKLPEGNWPLYKVVVMLHPMNSALLHCWSFSVGISWTPHCDRGDVPFKILQDSQGQPWSLWRFQLTSAWNDSTQPGWWYTYPSEKWWSSSVGMILSKCSSHHQPATHNLPIRRRVSTRVHPHLHSSGCQDIFKDSSRR